MKFKKFMLVSSLSLTFAMINISPASAEWVGNVVSEKPSGQGVAALYADEDGVMRYDGRGVYDALPLSWRINGMGTITVKIYDSAGTLIIDDSAYGDVSAWVADDGRSTSHPAIGLTSSSQSGTEHIINMTNVDPGTRTHIQVSGSFNYHALCSSLRIPPDSPCFFPLKGRATYEFRVQ